ERAPVPFINEADVFRIDIEAACDESARGIDGLSVAPHRDSVAVPFGDTPAGLHGGDDASGVVVRKFLDDVGFPESLLDIAILSQRCGEVSPSLCSSSTSGLSLLCSSCGCLYKWVSRSAVVRRSRRHKLVMDRGVWTV